MMNLHYGETDHIQIYSAHRPEILPEIAQMTVDFLKEEFDDDLEIAVDVGCGSGQSSVILAPFFHKVHGLDASANQIQEALKKRSCSNVHYRVGEAENLPFESCCVQLVTACASLHWFDTQAFLREARRILMPGGVLAAYTYNILRPFLDSPQGKEKVESLYQQITDELYPYWPTEVHASFEKYRNVHFPFEECRRVPDIRQCVTGKITNLTGFIESLSAFRIMKKTSKSKADSFINSFKRRLHELLELQEGEEEKEIKLCRDFYCVLCRKK